MQLRNLKNKASGFTLVEMAIVLVIIGIILAGVMKGRDIVRGAQVKQFSQQFAQKWGTVCQTYYDKTGQQLLDGNGNGNGVAAGGAAATVPDGRMDSGLIARLNAATANDPVAVLQGVGITPCTLIKSKFDNQVDGPFTNNILPSCRTGAGINARGVNIGATQVEGEYAGTKVVQVDLVFLTLANTGVTTTLGRNCVVIYQVPDDVAIGLDTAIDGTVNGDAGSCVNLGDSAALLTPASTTITTTDWPAANAGGVSDVAIILDF